MTTFELKSILHQKIENIQDKTFLSAINTIIESQTQIYKTSKKQKDKIIEGLADLKKGEQFSNEEVDKEISKWLKEK